MFVHRSVMSFDLALNSSGGGLPQRAEEVFSNARAKSVDLFLAVMSPATGSGSLQFLRTHLQQGAKERKKR